MEWLYFIGFWVIFGLIGWLLDEVPQFIEDLRYGQKLKKLSPQLQQIDLDYLPLALKEVKAEYEPVRELLLDKHKFSPELENAKTLSDYVREEAEYRRSKRKAPIRATQSRPAWRKRRYSS